MATLWHGRFSSDPSDALLALSNEAETDLTIAYEDVRGSIAHVHGLVRSGLLTSEEGDTLEAGLNQVLGEIEEGSFTISVKDEDVHMAVEQRLSQLVGEVGGKLHTGRSRNDQVSTDLRLYTRRQIVAVVHGIFGLQYVLMELATQAGNTYLPGYTHLQRAQPVLLSHHFAAHAWALTRDVDRLLDTRARLDVSPLGAGALAGSSLPLDPVGNAQELGFAAVFQNSLDVTSDRDFVAETLFDIALLGVHLSRIAEEIVLWTTDEFGFMKLDDAFSTGSSMMPQKKNPDIAELARGKSGIFIGHVTGVLATLKGLPLAFNRDVQTIKPPLFEALKDVRAVLLALGGALQTATFNVERMQGAADSSAAGATDLAEWLVQRGVAFRQAHGIVGAAVGRASEAGLPLMDVVVADPQLGPEAAALLEPGVSVKRRTTPGGAGPEPVAIQLQGLAERIRADEARLAAVGS